jgi:hypothetical protein
MFVGSLKLAIINSVYQRRPPELPELLELPDEELPPEYDGLELREDEEDDEDDGV